MVNDKKNENSYRTIGEVTKELGLINKKNGRLQTHTIRYWETQFNQIKPRVRAGNRRYYSAKDFKVIKHIKFLLKDRGLTINGAKKLLNNDNVDDLDDNMIIGINNQDLNKTKIIKEKVRKISKIIKELKKFK
tara:strand:- start:4869 stop:5267 length:399 start_codon:yes stop_codon:yes gene_type:complete